MNFPIAYNQSILRNEQLPFALLNNRSFLYGDGLFETIKIVQGTPFHLKEHLERLSTGIQALKITIDLPELNNTIFKLLASINTQEHGTLKIQVFRNEGGKYIPQSSTGSYIISFKVDECAYVLNTRGWKVDVFEDISVRKTPFSSFKALSGASTYIQAGIFCREQKLDHSLLLNEKGLICEGLSTNVFLVKNGMLFTPKLNYGGVHGIMRKIIIQIAAASNIKTIESEIKLHDLETCDELFLTNVVHGIRWVMSYRRKRYVNKVSKQLMEILNEKITQSIYTTSN